MPGKLEPSFCPFEPIIVDHDRDGGKASLPLRQGRRKNKAKERDFKLLELNWKLSWVGLLG